ncbi:MAG: hypothetical protein IJF16_10720 [Clostridia bacterium]|nr:hypothetical protein [Clostridia bacterium]
MMKKHPVKTFLRALLSGALSLLMALSLFGCQKQAQDISPIMTFDPGDPIVDEFYEEHEHGDEPEYDDEQVIDISALESMTEAALVNRYCATFVNVDAEPLVYYVFGLLDDVTYYTDVYEGEVAKETTVIWTSDSDITKYMSCMEYGELYFERGDVYESGKVTRTPEQVDKMVREVLSLHGVPNDNLVFGGKASNAFYDAGENMYYYYVDSLAGLPVSHYNLGIFVMANEDITALSYKNISDEVSVTGDMHQTISAYEAAQKIFELSEEELRFYDDLIFESAQLVYDIVGVKDHPDKGVLTPMWELYTKDNTVLQVDAITGDIIDGLSVPYFTIDQYNGNW